ncbi:hypothetical protein QJQ45_013001 [Haematococcus lacustris]|nr:hypothetical protein QJQ45_013001 [Haematococcus lacustris]
MGCGRALATLASAYLFLVQMGLPVTMAASAASDDAVGRHRIKPPNRRQHRLEVDHIDEESGAWSHLRYNVELREDLVLLSQELHLTSVLQCGEGKLRLLTTNVATVEHWQTGTIVVGDASWQCSHDEAATPSPFYLRILSPPHSSHCTWVHATPTCLVSFHTAPASMDQCFRHANMHFKRLPLAHTDHPFNSEDGLRQLLQRASQSPGVIPSAAILSLNISSAAHRKLTGVWGSAWNGVKAVGKGALNEASSAVSGVASVATGLYQAAGVAAELLQGNPVVLNGQKELDLLAMNWDTRSRSVQSPVLPLMNSGGLQVVCNNCYAHMAAGIQFNMVIRGMSSPPFVYVDSMLLTVYGSLAVNMDVAVSSTGRTSASSRPLTLVPDRQIATITFPVAFIPVHISFAVGLQVAISMYPSRVTKVFCLCLAPNPSRTSGLEWAYMQAKLTVRTAVPGTLSLGFDYTRSVTMGVEYRSQWEEMRRVPSQTFDSFNTHPLKLSMTKETDVEVSLLPTLTATLWSVTDFVIQPSANLGVQLALAAPGCSGVQYRTYYGLDLGLTLSRIELRVPLTSWTLSLGGDILPWSSTFTLIGKVESARAFQSDALCPASTKPVTSQACNTQACGLGPCLTTCTAAMLSNTKCDGQCMSAQCGYDNGMCAQQQAVAVACSSQTTCITCLQTTAGSCGWCASSGTCMNGDSVGPSTGTCAGTTWWTTQCQADEPSLVLTTPSSLKAGTTNRLSWTGGQSSSGQVKISIRAFGSSIVSKLSGLIGRRLHALPDNASFHDFIDMAAGGLYQLALGVRQGSGISRSHLFIDAVRPLPMCHSGAGSEAREAGMAASPPLFVHVTMCPAASRRQLGAELDETGVDALVTGFGIPAGSVANTGSFSWTLTPGLPSAYYQLFIASASDPTNFALSNSFYIDGTVDTFVWAAGDWSACSQNCGSGSRTRSVACVLVGPCMSGGCPACSCKRQPSGYGFFCGTVYSGPFGPTTIGCDSNSGTGYQECCRRQGLTCDDGCTGKAKWVELPSGRGACSAACGGGRQTRNFQCLGYYDPGCGGTPTQCAQPVTCYDFQCSGPYPGGPSTLYECNTQPCTSYTWSVTAWDQCSRDCSAGNQARTVVCLASVAGQESAIVADSLCVTAGLRPADQQACNTEPCVETQLHLSAVQAVQMVPAGSAFNLTWSGGLQYGRVSASLQQVAVGVAGQLLANTTWQDAGLGLPVDVENTLSSRWAVPATLASGQYLLKLTSSATPANQDVMATPVVVQGTVGYELTLLPVGLGAALGSAATLQLVVYGTHGQTAATHLSLGAAWSAGGGARSLVLQGLDVGLVQRLGLTLPASASLNAVAAVLHSLGRTYELRARRGHSDGVWKANRPAGTTSRTQSEWLEGREMWLIHFGLQGNLYRVRCTACDLVLCSHLHTIQKLEAIKQLYCQQACLSDGTEVPPLLCSETLATQQSQFAEVMRDAANSPGMGISQLWQSLSKQPITALDISEYGRLAELAMVMVPGSVEEERMAFHTVTHGVSDFPYHEAIGVWLDAANKKGRYGACPTASFLPQLAIGEVCGMRAGDSCVSTPALRAVATVTVNMDSGSPILRLDGTRVDAVRHLRDRRVRGQ